jgi:hypothetical protein
MFEMPPFAIQSMPTLAKSVLEERFTLICPSSDLPPWIYLILNLAG